MSMRGFRRTVSWRTVPAWGVTAFLAIVAAYYVFVVSAGRFDSWFTWSAVYNSQAEGFRAGHLYLPEPAPPELKALADPLDRANMKYWRWDYSYFEGRLYIYWGLVPAALLAATKALFRIKGTVGDEVLVVAFLMGRALAGILLIRELASRRDTPPPAWAIWVAMAVFVTANPTPFLLTRAAVYEASIAAGGCFMVLGFYLALRAVYAERETAAAGWMVAASFGFGLAAGARLSLQPSVMLLLAFTALTVWRARGGGVRRLIHIAGCGATPAMLILATHFLLNHLRYGQWSEFGLKYQMTGVPFHLGARFVIPNLYHYLLEPVTRSCAFPFLTTEWIYAKGVVPHWLPFPDDYTWEEPNAGFLILVPFTWFTLGAVGLLVRDSWRRSDTRAPTARAQLWRRRWVGGALGIWVVSASAPLLLLFIFSMRYQADFMPAVLLMATLAGWRLLAAPACRTGRSVVAMIYLALAAATVVQGILLGFDGYLHHFEYHNPALSSWLERVLSRCHWLR